MSSYAQETPVFRPTKEEFSRPFTEYVRKVLRKYPDIAMFKVVPPEGWRPRRAPFPKLTKLDISCPIKQLAFGTRGSYQCMLVEQKALTAEQFKALAEDEQHKPPASRDRKEGKDKGDELLERAFWSSVTINPPLYGADTPMSFFDEALPYGWNLRDLGCLLKNPNVPRVPGVTTPMTYFGMWKSFFAWHVEDADLFSINYLHFGAPKVWYCVAPGSRAKFERMAQSECPELHRGCSAFLRHKDVLLSPALLRTYGVEYMQAKQEPNEFIVLNAGAYHAGYNLGFNCAEAVNFATQEWVSIGRAVQRCKCPALKDGVRISMRLFGCSSGSSASSDGEDDDEDEEDSGSDNSSRGEEDEVDSGGGSGYAGSDSEEAGSASRSGGSGGSRPKRAAAAAAVAHASAAAGGTAKRQRRAGGGPATPPPTAPGPRKTRTSLAAAASASKMRRTHATAEARARLATAHERTTAKRSSSTAAGVVGNAVSGAVAAATAAAGGGGGGSAAGGRTTATAAKRQLAKPVAVPAKGETLSESLARAAAAAAAIRARMEEQAVAIAAAGGAALATPRVAIKLEPGGEPLGAAARPPPGDPSPQVIIGEERGAKYFYMVQVLSDVRPRKAGCVVMRALREGRDGLFRPCTDEWEEVPSALVGVRTQWVPPRDGRQGGYKLLTLRSRILDTDLIG